MLKAETVVLDYKRALDELETMIDARLAKRELKFNIGFRQFKDIPMEYIKTLVKRYATEGGWADAEVERYCGDQRDPCDDLIFRFVAPTVIIRP